MKKSEIRKDYITNRYVIIAPGRKKRPHQFAAKVTETHAGSPLTPEMIKKNKEKILDTVGSGARRIVTVPNVFPAVTPQNSKAYGFQEVIVETPNPNLKLVQLSLASFVSLFKMYQKRTRALMKKEKINYVLCFKNEGSEAGASISHAHSQIFSTQIVPPRVIETQERLNEYKIEHGHSLYRDIIAKEMKSPRRVFEDRNCAVFCPYASAYENEIWIVTKREVGDISKLKPTEIISIAKSMKKILTALAPMNAPYNYFFHALKGTMAEHLCIRVEPRAHIWAGVELDSSMTVNWVPPEEAAKMYRKFF